MHCDLLFSEQKYLENLKWNILQYYYCYYYYYYYFIKRHDKIKTVFCRFSNINVFFSSSSSFCIYIHVHFLLLFQMKLCFLIFIFTLPAVQGEVPNTNTNPNANLPVQYSTVDYRTEFVQATRGTYRGI